MQVKLLRAIQESEFERVGGIKTIKVDVRLDRRDQPRPRAGDPARQLPRGPVLPAQRRAAAASRRCASARGDIPLLVAAHHQEVQRAAEEERSPASPTRRSPRSRPTRWPGNIRELENVLERTILFCKGDRIERADLQLALGERARAAALASRSRSRRSASTTTTTSASASSSADARSRTSSAPRPRASSAS